MIFSAAYQYGKSISIIERVISLYISISWHHILAISLAVYRNLSDDIWRTGNTPMIPHISDKLGTEIVW